MKIQTSRFAAITSALSLVVTGLVGVQPASAAAPTATSRPTIAISGATITKVDTVYSGSPSAIDGYYVCDSAVTASISAFTGYVNGNGDWWIADTTNPSGAGATIGTGTGCVVFTPAAGPNSTLLVTGASVGHGGQTTSYDPTLHGTHIIYGTRVTVIGDSRYYWELSTSAQYVVPTMSISSASVSTDGRTVTLALSEAAASVPPQDFTLNVDGTSRPATVVGIANGATTVTLTLTAQNAIASGAVVTLSYAGGVQGQTRLRAQSSPSITLPNFSAMSVTNNSTVVGGGSPSQVVTTPYTGPVVTPPAAVSFRPGGKAVLPGSNLSGVSKVTVDGLDCAVKVNSAGEIEITVPSSLKPGVYDLVIVSDSGTLTVQDGLRVSSSVVLGSNSSVIPSTKLKEDSTVKVYVNDVVGAGKVQIMHNGVEIAWVSASSESDPKLRDGYLVRTIELAPGKNVIEVFVVGKRVDRKAYTKVDDSSRS